MNPQPLITQCELELKPVDAVAQYEAELRLRYNFGKMGGPFTDMNPATVLREIDPIQWQIGLNKFCARKDVVKVGSHYYDRVDAILIAVDVSDRIRHSAHSLRIQQRENPADHDVLGIRIANLEAEAQEIKTYIQ